MKAVITGANSFIGQCLSQKLQKSGWEVIHVVRTPGKLINNVKQVCLPMEEYHRLGDEVGACDCFISLAWNGTRGASRMERDRQQSNVKYSVAGLKSVLKVGCGRVVTAGSQAEYGPHTEVIRETSECHPNTEYGKAKLEYYAQVKAMCSDLGIQYKEPRFFSLYGPNDYPGTMIMSILGDMIANRPCKLTAGVQMWDFLYISDAIEALSRLCTWNCSDGVYNFGSGDARPLKEYVLEMADITRTKSELQFGAVPYPKTGMVSIWPDVSKLMNELDWQPRVSFKQGIQTILAQLSKNG